MVRCCSGARVKFHLGNSTAGSGGETGPDPRSRMSLLDTAGKAAGNEKGALPAVAAPRSRME
jgi:hypothetical protein